MPEKRFHKRPWWKRLTLANLLTPKMQWRLHDVLDSAYFKLIRYVNVIFAVVTVVIIGVAVAAVMARRNSMSPVELESEYHAGLVAGDYQRAASALEDLKDQAPPGSDLEFDKAVLEYKLGNKEESKKSFEAMSLSGHIRASVWLLNDLFGQADLAKLDAEQKQRFNELLSRSGEVKLSVDKSTRNELASRFYLANGQTEQAITHLKQLVEDHPEKHLTLATVYQSLNQPVEANQHFKRAADYLAKELSKNDKDIPLRLQLIELHQSLNDEKQALAVASKGYQITRNVRFQQAKTQSLLVWARRLKAESAQATLEERIALIYQATQYTPQDLQLIQTLQEMLLECHTDSDIEQRLIRSIENGPASESLHFFIGMLYLLQDKFDAATPHLEFAAVKSSAVNPALAAFMLQFATAGAAQHARASSIIQRLHERVSQDEAIQSAWKQLTAKDVAPDTVQ